MKSRFSCATLGAGLTFLLGLLVVSVFLFWGYFAYRQKQARTQFAPPTVLVTDPVSSISAAAGSYLNVSATALGARPIVRAELWLDGQLVETQNSEQPEGFSPFYSHFAVLVPSAGAHMLFVRAVNRDGVIGQSLAVNLTGEPKPAETFLVVTSQEGETLEDIATAYAAAAEKLQTLNPGLGDQLPAGTLVKVPAPPRDEPPAGEPPSLSANLSLILPNLPMLTISDGPPINPFGIKMTFATKPPAAPTGLQAEQKGCDITLTWNDNADDEEKYNVYLEVPQIMDIPYLQATLNASPNTGPAWYKFQTPVEGAVSLWVEAENSIGKAPSNIVYIYLPFAPGCGSTVWEARSVQFQLLDISVSGNYDKVYCYVSLENQPEQRVPIFEGDFIQLQGGKGQQSSPYPFDLPLPSDHVLDLSGECMGWAGSALSPLGKFSGKFPLETWNGERRTLKGDSFEIGLSLEACRKYGKHDKTFFWGMCTPPEKAVDPTLPAPYEVREDLVTNPYPGQWVGHRTRTLSWKWDGDRNKNDIFQIFLNGEPYARPFAIWPGEELKVAVERPRDCGETIIWQVAVKRGLWSTWEGQGPGPLSPLSAPLKVELPECSMWLRATFETIDFEWTHDGAGNWDPFTTWSAEPLDSYFWLCVGNYCRYFYGGGFYRPVQAHGTNGGLYSIAGLIDEFHPYGKHPNVIVVPLHPGESLRQYQYTIHAEFWDHDDWTSDDLIGKYGTWLNFSAPPKGEVFKGNCVFEETTSDQVTGEALSNMTFSYEIYPNKCADIPPEILELTKEAGK